MSPAALASMIRGLIGAYAAQYPGRLGEYARANRSLVFEIVRQYGPMLSNPFVQLVIAARAPNARQLLQAQAPVLVESVLQLLQAEPGEVGMVARTYPQWVRSELLLLIHEAGRRL